MSFYDGVLLFNCVPLKNFCLSIFIYGCAESLLPHWPFSSCVVQALHCGGVSCCRAQVLGHTGFSSHCKWAQELWLIGSRA